ncbi:MAG TPA: protein phosphatase 2C domain-containing protein [Gemmataceae bacterium]|nr:protein phosphatase 2C domain-containing protein [Gemmataceae bacterium]
MATLVIRVGSRSDKGVRPNNEDTLVADRERDLYLVADGMGGQEAGEMASGLAAEIIPRAVQDRLAQQETPSDAVQHALAEANAAIVHAGRNQPAGRRMGTTAVVAVRQAGTFYVAGLGDSRAYLIRQSKVDQLTVDHSVAQALELNGTLTAEQARNSPWQHVLYRFLGCAEMTEGAEVRPFIPEEGDRLLLASDGLTNHITADDLSEGGATFPDPQAWADHLVRLALSRGSRDNVTCIVVAFDKE